MTSTSSTGVPGSGPRVRATLFQPYRRKACCAAADPGGTVSVARSSGRSPRMRFCSALPMPWRRHAARTASSVSANVRPGCSATVSSGSGVISSFHHEVDGRSGMPHA
jgi:hypothetical protein